MRAGQARRLYSGLFTNRVVVRSERGDHATHWSQILLDYARAIGCDTADAQPRIVTTPDDERDAAALLRVHDVAGPFVLLHPTRGLSAQRARWPIDGFVELSRALTAREGLPLLVTGTTADARIAHAIADGADRSVISIAGATSIGVFAALARRAAFVVAMDSGPMHVAAAAGAPTVGIFALQSDEPDRWAPLGARTAVVRRPFRARPITAKRPARTLPASARSTSMQFSPRSTSCERYRIRRPEKESTSSDPWRLRLRRAAVAWASPKLPIC